MLSGCFGPVRRLQGGTPDLQTSRGSNYILDDVATIKTQSINVGLPPTRLQCAGEIYRPRAPHIWVPAPTFKGWKMLPSPNQTPPKLGKPPIISDYDMPRVNGSFMESTFPLFLILNSALYTRLPNSAVSWSDRGISAWGRALQGWYITVYHSFDNLSILILEIAKA